MPNIYSNPIKFFRRSVNMLYAGDTICESQYKHLHAILDMAEEKSGGNINVDFLHGMLWNHEPEYGCRQDYLDTIGAIKDTYCDYMSVDHDNERADEGDPPLHKYLIFRDTLLEGTVADQYVAIIEAANPMAALKAIQTKENIPEERMEEQPFTIYELALGSSPARIDWGLSKEK